MAIKTIEYKNNKLKIIDQRMLPGRLVYKNLSSLNGVKSAIKGLAVRGAPAIGVAAAYGLCIGISGFKQKDKKIFFNKIEHVIKQIHSTRPTAVNISWALQRLKYIAVENKEKPVNIIKELMLDEAKKIDKEDKELCRKIGEFGSRLIKNNDVILTHCNAGALATAGQGTALSAIYFAKKQGKKIRVYADETRPLLQGARLTAWELLKNGIDVTLICDNMAASLIKDGRINKIMVGADRIVQNGDFANKIGTYNLAVLARFHKIPFYVLAPGSSFDFSMKNAKHIPIEKRNPDEIRKIKGNYISPKNVKTYNPAFDITPGEFVTAFITDKGIFKKPCRCLRT